MDDLKLYVNTRKSQEKQINILKLLSNNIRLSINNNKCTTFNINNKANPILGFPLICKKWKL